MIQNQKCLNTIVIFVIFLLVGVGTAAAHDKNSSAENLATENCTEVKYLQHMRVFTSNNNITSGTPGRIEGAFLLGPKQDCPVVVEVSLSASAGVTISERGGPSQKYPSYEFILYPERYPEKHSMKSFSAEVFSKKTGIRTVDSQIQYWPIDHPDSARMVNATHTFQVEEPIKQYDTTDSSNSHPPEITSNSNILILIVITIVGTGWLFLKSEFEL